MKLIKEVAPPCPCYSKITKFAGRPDETVFGTGTEVECDCGQVYVLTNLRYAGGRIWMAKAKATPPKRSWWT